MGQDQNALVLSGGGSPGALLARSHGSASG